jgi:type VI secretion system protein ImpG
MDRRLLGYYNRELQYIRQSGVEFAREFPKIAGRLALDDFDCPDPFVERLLEGFAFLAARVQLKLDSEFPRFTQSVLQTLQPDYLAPTPSMAIVRIEPDSTEGSVAEGYGVARNTAIRSRATSSDETTCEYRTAQAVTLWPIRVAEAEYHVRSLGALDLAPTGGERAALRLRLETTGEVAFNELPLDSLTFYIHDPGSRAGQIYEQLLGHTSRLVVKPTSRPAGWRRELPATSQQRVGFNDEESLLPHDSRAFTGFRCLREYFAFPQRYLFVRVSGLRKALEQCDERSVDLVWLLDGVDEDLEGDLEPSKLMLFCTPAINLFPRRADRIPVSDRFSEYQVVVDRTKPLDFEVFRLRSVTGYGQRSDAPREFSPFYSARGAGSSGGAYYVMNRVPRVLSAKERQRGARTRYAGSEVYLSLVDETAAPYDARLRQLGVDVLCTNRDLPLQMPVGQGGIDFTCESGGPIAAIDCVAGPTAPHAAEVEGEFTWRLISHFSLNYLSLVGSNREEGAAALRELLSLYGNSAVPEIRRQLEGLRTISTKPIVRRVPRSGPVAFARGLEVSVGFDETCFEGIGCFLLGSVLEHFLANYVSINSYTETVVRSIERGEIMRWPARIGTRMIA